MAETIQIEKRSGLAIATIMARTSNDAASIGSVLGVPLSARPVVTAGQGVSFLGTGPGTWLAVAESEDPSFASDLADTLADVAAVSDQSSSYVVFRILGEGARTLLCRGASIDFHSAVFSQGAVASTVIAHIGVIIWQIDDTPTYDLAVLRSFEYAFRHWLDETAVTIAI